MSSVPLSPAPAKGAARALRALEHLLFGHRAAVLAALALLTLVMAWFAAQLRMDAGFDKQMPIGHEYVETFRSYRDDLLGANRLTVVVRAAARSGPARAWSASTR
jgi:predicted RND superfamily exporter protein